MGMVDSRRTMFWRAARRRCPVCGAKPIFSGWFALVPRCPECNFSFEREEGYWVGALIANIAVAEALFAIVLIGGIVATHPDVPWMAISIVGIAVMIGLPILFYPLSKTLWLWLDLAFIHPLDADDLRHND